MPNDEDRAQSPIEAYRENYQIMQTRSGDGQLDCERLAVLRSMREGKPVAFQRPDGQGVTVISEKQARIAFPMLLQATLQIPSEEEARCTLFLERLRGQISEESDILAAIMQSGGRTPPAQIARIKSDALEHCTKARMEITAALESLGRNLLHAYEEMYGGKIAPDK